MAISVGAMVLVIAELASKYPFAGSMYQWPTILAGKRVGWWMGWVYAGAMFPLMTAYYASLPVLIHPLFNLAPSFHTDEIIIVIAAVIAVGWNIVRIGILGRITQWAMALELTVVTVVCLLTFILGVKHFGNLTQTAAVTTTSSGAATVQALSGLGNVFPLFVGAGVFNALWVLYTFENGGTLGEETVDAGRNAPARRHRRLPVRDRRRLHVPAHPDTVDPGHEGRDARRGARGERDHGAPAGRRLQAVPGGVSRSA